MADKSKITADKDGTYVYGKDGQLKQVVVDGKVIGINTSNLKKK